MKRMHFKRSLSIGLFTLLAHGAVAAETFTLTSTDIAHGEFMAEAQEFNGFGCTGDDISPQLSWRNPPKGAQAFALLAYDPDAPTGSGWWHWQVVNLPAETSELKAGAGNPTDPKLPAGTLQTRNDYGAQGFGGACPPPGDGAHRYQFTIHALSKKLELPEYPSAALTGYMVNAHSLGSATIEALYKR